eukprot:m.13199 g.13199  ORF g.13199 m.13199 type:complete len:292 (+) comp4487_c0_seq1:1063-1938(+)
MAVDQPLHRGRSGSGIRATAQPHMQGGHGAVTGFPEIRDVWEGNLEEEMRAIRDVIVKYPYIAMDTEFPGVVAKPIGDFRTQSDYQFQSLRCNVDLLKLIQLGVTFFDEHGNRPPHVSTWQFNFRFSLSSDMFAQDSIDLLKVSGIQFARHEVEGIDVSHFGELLITSGLVLNDDVTWVTFHSGYDFGYLLKVLTASQLPAKEAEFFELLRIYAPVVYDIKYLMKSCKTLKGGLQDVADDLGVQRVGPQHQAGSDSLLTGMAFFKMRELFFEGLIDDEKFNGMLFGLGTSY